MSTSEITDIDLMLYVDGELDGEERDRIDELVSSDANARAKVESLRQVSSVVAATIELSADEAAASLDSDELWKRIERGIGDAPVAQRELARRAASEGGGGVAGWFERFRWSLMAGMAAAAAAALAVWFLKPPVVVEKRVEVTAPDRGTQGAAIRHAVLQAQKPEVEDLEVNEGSGMILTIPGDNDENPTTVIWISPTEESQEDPL